jgi:hypothetical protein
MKGRFYFADGRIKEDVNLDDRATRHCIPDDDVVRWFKVTGQVEGDGFVVLREIPPTPPGQT